MTIYIKNLGTLPVKFGANNLGYSGNYAQIFGGSTIELSSDGSSWSSPAAFTDLTPLDTFLANFNSVSAGTVKTVYAKITLSSTMNQSAAGTSGTYTFDIVGTLNP